MTALLRSASLTSFAEVAAECGLDAHALVVEAGLPARCLKEPDLKIPAPKVAHLLEIAATRAGEPAFALRMVELRRLSNLGPLGLLVREEPTLRSALEAVVRHLHLHNEALAVTLEQSGNLVVIRQHLLGEGGQPMRQAAELALGVMHRVIAVFMGAGWRPRVVCLTHRAPPALAVHRRIFGDAVEFGHAFNGIVCNAADLDVPNPGADPVMARYAEQLLAPGADAGAQRQQQQQKLSARVRQLVVVLLPRGLCRVEVVAQHLGIDRRTVARHLAADDTSFSALMNEMRCDLLGRYLKEGARSLTEVSALLGFSAPSAFSRWHRQQFGRAVRASASVR